VSHSKLAPIAYDSSRGVSGSSLWWRLRPRLCSSPRSVRSGPPPFRASKMPPLSAVILSRGATRTALAVDASRAPACHLWFPPWARPGPPFWTSNSHFAFALAGSAGFSPCRTAIGNSFELLDVEHILRLRGDVGELPPGYQASPSCPTSSAPRRRELKTAIGVDCSDGEFRLILPRPLASRPRSLAPQPARLFISLGRRDEAADFAGECRSCLRRKGPPKRPRLFKNCAPNRAMKATRTNGGVPKCLQ
jgi:hypothetical protein